MNLSAIGPKHQEVERARRWLVFSDVFGAAIGSGIAVATLVVILA